MARLFVAVWPDPSVVEALHALHLATAPGVRPVPASNWHVTLRFLGDTDADAVVERLVAADLPTATVEFGPAVERLGRDLLVVPAAGADDLAAAVGAATADLGERDRRRFLGHLTVARTRGGARSAAFGRPITATQTVHQVALVDSELTPQGAAYTTRATFRTSG